MHDLGAPRASHGANQSPVLPPPERRRSKLARWFDSWMRSLGMALVLFLVNKAVYGAQIPGTSARLPGFDTPSCGDVIVFAYPKDPTLNYVKRVIGAPGDLVEMRAGQVYVNSVALDEPYVQRIDPLHDSFESEFNWQRSFLVGGAEQRRGYHPTRDTWGPLVGPAGKCFVLGDNRDNSADSRYWGFVDASAVKGRPLVVYFSYDRGTRDALPWLTDIRLSRLGSQIH